MSLIPRTLSVSELKYRTRAEIVSELLEAAKEDVQGVIRTKMMYSASLSFTQSKEYLKLVLDRGLLEYDTISKRFRLTAKGIVYLEMFQQTSMYLKEK